MNKETNLPIDRNVTADFINKYFANVGPKLAHKFSAEWSYDGPEVCYEMDMIQTSYKETSKIVRNINIYTASSVANLSSRILKDALSVLIPNLTYMINLSPTTGIFPPKWKIAKIVPLQKSGDHSDVNNLRPASFTR